MKWLYRWQSLDEYSKEELIEIIIEMWEEIKKQNNIIQLNYD